MWLWVYTQVLFFFGVFLYLFCFSNKLFFINKKKVWCDVVTTYHWCMRHIITKTMRQYDLSALCHERKNTFTFQKDNEKAYVMVQNVLSLFILILNIQYTNRCLHFKLHALWTINTDFECPTIFFLMQHLLIVDLKFSINDLWVLVHLLILCNVILEILGCCGDPFYSNILFWSFGLLSSRSTFLVIFLKIIYHPFFFPF